MRHLLARLTLYSGLAQDSILRCLADALHRLGEGGEDRDALMRDIHVQVRRLLELATDYGFDRNLWHDYLAFELATAQNPFSLTCERTGAREGSVNGLARGDMGVFRALFRFDFRPVEAALGINCFSLLSDYRALDKPDRMVNRDAGARVRALSDALSDAGDEGVFFDVVTGFYRDCGAGLLGLNRAFRVRGGADGAPELLPIHSLDPVLLSDLVGYEAQKQELVANTEAFLRGQRANNALLYGDSGTGKSTSVKALSFEYYDRGLRIIEFNRHQFEHLSAVISRIQCRNYRFILFLDDLSFEQFETDYKYLKAVIEGGLQNRPDNVLIYATSNRRHLIRETWSDRNDLENDDDVHRSDTVEEKLSLVSRFGVTIRYGKPGRGDYLRIVAELAARAGLTLPADELAQKAAQWEMRHGGLSGRTARQFIDHLSAQ